MSTSPQDDRRIPKGFWSVWAAVAIDLLGFGIVIPLLPLYAERFEASPFTIGALFASYSLAQLVFSPVWGRVSDRIGRRPILLLTIAGSALGSLILGLAGSLVMLFVGRIVDGVSGASVAVARATVADVATPEQRPRLMGLLGAAFGLGFVVGPAIGGLAALAGPSIPFLLAAGLSVVNLIMAAVRLPETKKATPRDARADERVSLSTPILRLIAVGFGAIAAFAAFEATFALLASDRLDADASTVAWLFAAVGVILMAAQGGLVGPITDRLGEANVIRLGQALDLVGFVIIGVSTTWLPLFVGLLVLALGQGLLTPALSSAVAAMSGPGRAGYTLGVQQSTGGLARVIGPLMGGLLYAVDIPIPYLVSAGISLVVLPLVPRLIIEPPGVRAPAESAA